MDLHHQPSASEAAALLLSYRAIENWFFRPALPRHDLLYERSALLVSATEELFVNKLVLPQGLAP
jgi:hypothetical protein